MNETDTPETAAKIQAGFTSEELMGFHVPAAFAEKLERERDEARRRITELEDHIRAMCVFR